VNENTAEEKLRKLFPTSQIEVCGNPRTSIWWLDSMKRSAVFTLGSKSSLTEWSKKTNEANAYCIATGAVDMEDFVLRGIILLTDKG